MRFLVALILCWNGIGETVRYETLPEKLISDRLSSAPIRNKEREQALRDLFVQAGCPEARLTEQPVKHAKAPNLVCALPGTLNSTIIVSAHFDFVEKGKGVVDNWSGASLLPSLLQSLRSQQRRHTILFIGFTDEENGLVGSSFYVHHLTPEQAKKISAVINLDTLGLAPAKIEMDRADKQLAVLYAVVAKFLHLPVEVVNVHQVGRSDGDSFQDAKIPTLMIHSVTTETFPLLHSADDQLSAIHMADYYQTYRLIATYLAFLDESLDKPAKDVSPSPAERQSNAAEPPASSPVPPP